MKPDASLLLFIVFAKSFQSINMFKCPNVRFFKNVLQNLIGEKLTNQNIQTKSN